MLWTALLLLTVLSPRNGAGFPNSWIFDGDVGQSAGSSEQHNSTGTGTGAECGPCVPELCPEVRGCRAGVVPDRCGCCAECGNTEGQPCDLGNSSSFYGLCGAGLRCTLDLRDLRYGDVLEPQCVCASDEAVCGSDGRSYANVCQLTAVAVSAPELRVESSGPCRAVPLIKVPPRNLVNVTGSTVIFMCEVFAFPMALIEWRKDGNDAILPGDDPHISVQSRGGPMRYELSSWLQIEGVALGDAGTYRCVAQNQLGSMSAYAVLAVLEPDEMSAFSSEDMGGMIGYDRQREYDEDYY